MATTQSGGSGKAQDNKVSKSQDSWKGYMSAEVLLDTSSADAHIRQSKLDCVNVVLRCTPASRANDDTLRRRDGVTRILYS